jgi:hypothetical protein
MNDGDDLRESEVIMEAIRSAREHRPMRRTGRCRELRHLPISLPHARGYVSFEILVNALDSVIDWLARLNEATESNYRPAIEEIWQGLDVKAVVAAKEHELFPQLIAEVDTCCQIVETWPIDADDEKQAQCHEAAKHALANLASVLKNIQQLREETEPVCGVLVIEVDGTRGDVARTLNDLEQILAPGVFRAVVHRGLTNGYGLKRNADGQVSLHGPERIIPLDCDHLPEAAEILADFGF